MIKIEKQSNLYIFLYSTAMVIIVAALLSIASTSLRPFQHKNIETEKRLDILRSVGLAQGASQAQDRHLYIEDEFNRVIVKQLVVSSKGETIEGVDAFNVDLRAELAKTEDQRNLPVYIAQLEDSSLKYIFPLRGRGLWGPIWGYMALNEDLNTIYGASFAHKSETPGLGAEIANASFQEQFKGKQIFSNGELVSISVVKGGAAPSDPHGVDGVSGGTITGQGLEDMLLSNLNMYKAFMTKQKELVPVIDHVEKERIIKQAEVKEEVKAVRQAAPARETTVTREPAPVRETPPARETPQVRETTPATPARETPPASDPKAPEDIIAPSTQNNLKVVEDTVVTNEAKPIEEIGSEDEPEEEEPVDQQVETQQL